MRTNQKIIDALNWDLIEYPKNLAIKNVIALSKDEEQMLIQAIYFNLTRKSVGILLTLFTGLRIGEFCEPQMADISLTDKTICVNKIVQRIYNKSTKEILYPYMLSKDYEFTKNNSSIVIIRGIKPDRTKSL